MVLGDWVDVVEKVAVPVGIVVGVLIAWKLGTLGQAYKKGKEFREKKRGKPGE